MTPRHEQPHPSARTFGAQLYTVRSLLPSQAEQTLGALAQAGFLEVEVVHDQASPGVARLAKDAGLAPVSLHVLAPVLTGNWTPWHAVAEVMGLKVPTEPVPFERIAAETRAQGLSYIVLAYLLPQERPADEAGYRALAERLNRAGEVARGEGLTLGYHNHGFEFVPLPGGPTGLDLLAAHTDPALVTFELDVFWAAMAGADPVATIQSLAGRVELLHLKDRAAHAGAETDEMRVPPDAFAEVGSGTLDFRAILAAGDAAGVRHGFVEQDHTPGDPVASLVKSLHYLRSIA